MKNEQGFSLIELMIVVAIIGIIAAYATTSYNDSVVKTKRSDAKASLMDIAARLERCYTMNGQYTTTAGKDCEVVAITTNLLVPQYSSSTNKYYDLGITFPVNGGITDTQNYTLTATPKTGVVDAKCTSFTLTNTGVKDADPGTDGNGAGCW